MNAFVDIVTNSYKLLSLRMVFQNLDKPVHELPIQNCICSTSKKKKKKKGLI